MPINFDSEEFKKNLKEQFLYILKHESRELLENVLNELVREKLEELANQELNALGKAVSEVTEDSVKALSKVQIHISNLDINHRELVRGAIRIEMKRLLQEYICENVK
ncbi:MAG: hypothetical protein ABIH42_04140 [Planctomycetota bacterium]